MARSLHLGITPATSSESTVQASIALMSCPPNGYVQWPRRWSVTSVRSLVPALSKNVGVDHVAIGMSTCVTSPYAHPSRSGGVTSSALSMLLICSRCSLAWFMACTMTTYGATKYPSVVRSCVFRCLLGWSRAKASNPSPLLLAACCNSANAPFRGGLGCSVELLVTQGGARLNELHVRPVVVLKYLHQHRLGHQETLSWRSLIQRASNPYNGRHNPRAERVGFMPVLARAMHPYWTGNFLATHSINTMRFSLRLRTWFCAMSRKSGPRRT